MKILLTNVNDEVINSSRFQNVIETFKKEMKRLSRADLDDCHLHVAPDQPLTLLVIEMKRMDKLRDHIREKFDNLEQGNIYGGDSWKITHASSFYSSVRRHLAKQINEMSFSISHFYKVMNIFEHTMRELSEAEDIDNTLNVDICRTLIHSMIKLMDLPNTTDP